MLLHNLVCMHAYWLIQRVSTIVILVNWIFLSTHTQCIGKCLRFLTLYHYSDYNLLFIFFLQMKLLSVVEGIIFFCELLTHLLYLFLKFIVLFFSFWPSPKACGILVPRPGIQPMPSAVKAWSPNHWTAREVPICWVFHFANLPLKCSTQTEKYMNPKCIAWWIFTSGHTHVAS